MKKILAVTGIRSEYFILQPVFEEICRRNELSLKVVVTGAHLSPYFGDTYKFIESDGYDIIKLNSLLFNDKLSGRCKTLGIEIMGLTDIVECEQPDWLMVLGDREESLAAAITGAYMNIPVIHICGGDRVVGNIDDAVRHAVTKLSHLHFPTTKENGDRIIKMGEEPFRVHVVGNPALDSIRKQPHMTTKQLSQALGLEISENEPLILLIKHPLSSETEQSYNQMKVTLEAVAQLKIKTIITYPNSDAGGYGMIKAIDEYIDRYPFIKAFKTLDRHIFVNVQRRASVMLGNSSAAVLETPFLKLPAVIVGNRQKQRQHASNIIFVKHDKAEIINAVKKAICDSSFKEAVNNDCFLYGDGYSSEKIAEIIVRTQIDSALINKQIVY